MHTHLLVQLLQLLGCIRLRCICSLDSALRPAAGQGEVALRVRQLAGGALDLRGTRDPGASVCARQG